jgi:hypothetical protein
VGEICKPVVVPVPEAAEVNVRDSKVPVVSEISVKVFILPVAVVEVILVVPKPVKAIEPEVPVKDNAPVVRVKPLEAVKTPAEVIVPVPVVEMLLEVLIVLPVEILPNPLAIDPDASAPTVVKLEVTTLEARVVPEIFAAALTVIEASGKVITRVPLVEAPVILKFIIAGVPEVPAK